MIVNRVPGHYWIQFGISLTGRCEPGHRWMYHGIIRRDAWRLGRVGVYLLRMPRQTGQQALARGRQA